MKKILIALFTLSLSFIFFTPKILAHTLDEGVEIEDRGNYDNGNLIGGDSSFRDDIDEKVDKPIDEEIKEIINRDIKKENENLFKSYKDKQKYENLKEKLARSAIILDEECYAERGLETVCLLPDWEKTLDDLPGHLDDYFENAKKVIENTDPKVFRKIIETLINDERFYDLFESLKKLFSGGE